MKRQSGFTLVEIAIVLVVIGLLLGGVLKGQELVMNAQIRNTINDYNNVASARFAYQDRYRRIPGDDDTANPRWSNAVNGDGDGSLGGSWDGSGTAPSGTNSSPAVESVTFWHHLRNDNLIAGSRGSSPSAGTEATFDNPQNAFNGQIGVQEAAIFNMTGDVICQSAIPGKAAALIDTRIDDGTGDGEGGDSGGLQGGDASGTSPVVIANYYTGTPASGGGSPTAAPAKFLLCREL